MRISACILVNQWHRKLPLVLESLDPVVTEILLGINGDVDLKKHPELQTYPKVKLIQLNWEGYGQTKNNLASFAANDWILSLDSDEVISQELQSSLRNINPEKKETIFSFSMIHFLGEKPLKYGAWGKGKKQFLRLYNKTFTSWDERAVHESIQCPEGTMVITLKGKVFHYTSENYDEFLRKNKYYANLAAKRMKREGKVVFPGRAILSAAFNLIKSYIFQFGFLDGKTGWQIAKGNALYTYWKYK